MLPVNSYAINYVIQTIIYKNTIIKFWLHEITFRILDNLVLAKKKKKLKFQALLSNFGIITEKMNKICMF